MGESIIVAFITGGLTLIGTIITVVSVNKKSQQVAAVERAVMKTKIDDLTREVREHNNFAQRMPVIEEKIKVINHRIEDLEQGVKS